ncbi:MAG: hypothetical protein ACPH3N_00935 [Alcanivorax sediminis]|uniref:hypothetical protein n=1 Tax=Alcanivorax sediminis TaxID=2663008 RepID=UPI003C63AD46
MSELNLERFLWTEDDCRKAMPDVRSQAVKSAVEKMAAMNEKTAEQALIVAQQERIAELKKALEPFADLVTAWSGLSEGLIDQLVLVNREDVRRAAALLNKE